VAYPPHYDDSLDQVDNLLHVLDLTYKLIEEWIDDYDLYANKIGLFRHPDKGKIYIAPGRHAPAPDSKLLECTHCTREGFVVVGGFIGTDDAIRDHSICIRNRFNVLIVITKLASINPQAAMIMLSSSINQALNHLCSVTPPLLLRDAATGFDNLVEDCRLQCLQCENLNTPSANADHSWQANIIASLPARDGGFDQIPALLRAPAAYLSTLINPEATKLQPPYGN
jgi:hypothetical protein